MTGRRFLWAAFLLWSAWLLWMLLLGRLDSAFSMPLMEYAAGHLNVVPFRTVFNQINLSLEGNVHALTNLGGNLFLFLPYGLFLPALFPTLRRCLPFLAAFGGGIVLVELSQFLLRVGFCEVDDVLLNCAGALLGFLIWKRWMRKDGER